MNPVCVVCVVTSDLVCCLFVTKRSQMQMTGVSAGECLFVCVVGPGFDSPSPAFVRSRVSQTAGSDGRPDQKTELCRHNLPKCLQHSNPEQAVSFWNGSIPFPYGRTFHPRSA